MVKNPVGKSSSQTITVIVMVKIHDPNTLKAKSGTIRYAPIELKSILHAYQD